MIYDIKNAQGSKVYDGGMTEIRFVSHVDTDKNEVTVYPQPVTAKDGEAVTETLRFESIKVQHIHGTQYCIDCYGRC